MRPSPGAARARDAAWPAPPALLAEALRAEGGTVAEGDSLALIQRLEDELLGAGAV